jgi:hypothetical protein
MSGCEMAETIAQKIGIQILNGIEYTTFYGHVIVIGAPYYRWDTLKQNHLNFLADHVHKYHGVIGIAHPRQIGDPICTGGTFDFKEVDFHKIDFVEQWHGVENVQHEWEKNTEFWRSIVDCGIKMTYLYGGDFHFNAQFKDSKMFNWVQIDTNKQINETVNASIANGKLIMSKGPGIELFIKEGRHIHTLGDIIKFKGKKSDMLYVRIFENTSKQVKIRIVNNLGILNEIQWSGQREMKIGIEYFTDQKWIRGELIDEIQGDVTAISNPIYFQQKN